MKKIVTRTLILVLFLATGAAWADVPSEPFSDRWVPNGDVFAVARSNGKVYIGGNFDEISPFTGSGVVIGETGGLDSSWPQVAGGSVEASVPDGLGGWFIGGNFTHIGGVPRRYLAHINSNGTLDGAWNPPDPDRSVNALVLSDGKIYVSGDFNLVGDTSRADLARFNQLDGALDSAWNPPDFGPYSGILTIAVSGGKVYAGGWFTTVGGTSCPYLARVNVSDGALDSAWNPPDPNDRIISVAVSGGKVYAGGGFTTLGGKSFKYLARFSESDGNVDMAWTPGPNDPVFSITSSGGKIYVGGHFTNLGGWLVRFNEPDGSLDSAWNPPDLESTVLAIDVSGGKVYAGGSFENVGGNPFPRLARFNESDGTLDNQWKSSRPNAIVSTIAVSGGKIFVGGWFNGMGGGVSSPYFARFNEADGSLDNSWTPSMPNGTVNSIFVSGGKIYLGGSFSYLGSLSSLRLGRLNESNGTVDRVWNPPDPNSDVISLAVSGGKVYAVGWFTTLGGTSFPYLARFNETNGALDRAWNPPDPNVFIKSIAVSSGKVYAGGWFTTLGGTSFPYLARFSESDGTLDSEWNPPDANDHVDTVAVSGGKVYAGGGFTTVGGNSFSHLARFNESNGSLDSAWKPPYPDRFPVSSLAVSGGKVYAGGGFYDVEGTLARFNESDGALDSNWTPPDPQGEIKSIAVNGDSLRVGGAFNSMGGHGAAYLAWFGNAITPAAPVSGGILAVSTQTISAAWMEVSGATGYTLEASLNSSNPPLSVESSATPSINNGTLSGFLPNKTYHLFVNACDVACSNFIYLGSTVTLANPPVSLSTASVTNTTVGLSFGANGNPAGTSYLVQQSARVGGPYATVVTTTLLTPTISGLTAGTTYYFQVLAKNFGGVTTAAVGPISVMTGLTPPGLILGTVGATSVQLKIAPNGNPAGTVYEVQQSADNGGTFTRASTGTNLDVTVTGLTAGTRYQFRVAALSQLGTLSTPSAVVIATLGVFSVDSARAYPVPFRPGHGRDTITFEQLPSDATVKLFTMRGQLVRSLTVEGNQVEWDVNNQEGQPVTSGVYLVVVNAAEGKKTFKVVVQR